MNSISAMNEYSDRSVEELRAEDYQVGGELAGTSGQAKALQLCVGVCLWPHALPDLRTVARER